MAFRQQASDSQPLTYKLMVNHSHSWGPARWLPGPASGRCGCMAALPKPLADKLKMLELGCMAVSVLLEPKGLDTAAASLEPVELSGLSMSMPVSEACSMAMTLLL